MGVVAFAGDGEDHDANAEQVVGRFELLENHASELCEDFSYQVEDADISQEADLSLSDLDSSRFVLRNISDSGPTQPTSPRAPYFTNENHKLVSAKKDFTDVAIFDSPEPQLVPFEDAELIAFEASDDTTNVASEPANDSSTHAQVAYQTQEPVLYQFSNERGADEKSPVEPKIPTLSSKKSNKGKRKTAKNAPKSWACLLYTSPSPRDATLSRMPSSA